MPRKGGGTLSFLLVTVAVKLAVPENSPLLVPTATEAMTTPVKDHYALGLQVASKNGRKRFAHGGGINGFGSFLAYFPASGVTIVVLSNVEGPVAASLEEQLETAYFGG